MTRTRIILTGALLLMGAILPATEARADHEKRGRDRAEVRVGLHVHFGGAPVRDHRTGVARYAPRRYHAYDVKVPPGHMPPPGACKVWYPGVPPGHQGPPMDCRSAEWRAYRTGGFVVYGDPVCRH
jgi:hypothetical protein